MTRTPTISLRTGSSIPVLGLGTYKSPPRKVGQAVTYAINECGYRHIDCAAVYDNEREIGEALAGVFSQGHTGREELFITSKLWNDAHAREDVEKACKQTLQDLRLEYLDLYLVHWGVAFPRAAGHVGGEPILDDNGVLVTAPIPMHETWEAMESLVDAGLVKAIGVSNFNAPMLLDLLSYARISPAMNQIELHPYNQQTRLVEFCQYKQIAVTAYSPLGRAGEMKLEGRPVLTEDQTVQQLADKYGKTPTQILLRWGIERGTVVIPKSVTPENIQSNSNVFDFSLTPEDMAAMAVIDQGYRYIDPYKRWHLPYFG